MQFPPQQDTERETGKTVALKNDDFTSDLYEYTDKKLSS